MISRRFLSVLVLLSMATACSAAGTATDSAPSSAVLSPAIAGGAGYLYVANEAGNSVTEYAPNSTIPLRTITAGVKSPKALAFDASGNLYVANLGSSSISVYAPGKTSVLRTITDGIRYPNALAFDPSGTLYVANYDGGSGTTVTEYAPGKITILRTIMKGIYGPCAMAFDPTGNLYVANNPHVGTHADVTEYAPGSVKPFLTVTVGAPGVYKPLALVPDASGIMYVAYSNGEALAFPAGSTNGSLANAGTGVNGTPSALTLDERGDVFVAILDANAVTENGPDGGPYLGKITNGIESPVALAFSGTTLYVANDQVGSDGSITVYKDAEGTLTRTITKGIDGPQAIAFSSK